MLSKQREQQGTGTEKGNADCTWDAVRSLVCRGVGVKISEGVARDPTGIVGRRR